MKRKKKGFTLVELLVVISIIALLMALLMPALGAAQRAGPQIVRCKANLKQLVIAVITYCSSNDVKAVVGIGGTEYWPMQLAPYLGDEKKIKYDHVTSPFELINQDIDMEKWIPNTIAVLMCPATKAAPSEPYKGNGNPGNPGSAIHRYRYHCVNVPSAYGINSWAGGWTGSGYANDTEKRRSYRYTGPDRDDIPLFADAVWIGGKPQDNDLTPGFWINACYLDTGGMLANEMGRFVTNRHGKDTNVGFWGGHVETMYLGELWNLQWHKQFNKRLEPNVLAGSPGNPNNHY